MEQTSELKQCSRCHSNILLEHFEKNRQGQLFKTCNNCRSVNRECATNEDRTVYLKQYHK